jgi:hypothetical protein
MAMRVAQPSPAMRRGGLPKAQYIMEYNEVAPAGRNASVSDGGGRPCLPGAASRVRRVRRHPFAWGRLR